MDDLRLALDRERREREEVESRLERERRVNKMQVRQLKKELVEAREASTVEAARVSRSRSRGYLPVAERSFSNLSHKSLQSHSKSQGNNKRPPAVSRPSRPISEHRLLKNKRQKSAQPRGPSPQASRKM